MTQDTSTGDGPENSMAVLLLSRAWYPDKRSSELQKHTRQTEITTTARRARVENANEYRTSQVVRGPTNGPYMKIIY